MSKLWVWNATLCVSILMSPSFICASFLSALSSNYWLNLCFPRWCVCLFMLKSHLFSIWCGGHSHKCLKWELCHIKLECDWLLCCWLLAFALAVEEKLNEECILFSYSQLFLITTSLSWASVFHNIFFNCKWAVDLSFFCPVHVKKWIFFYVIFLYLLYLAVLQ